MWNEKLQEIKKMEAIFGGEINDGATDEEVQLFLKEMKGSVREDKLQAYVNVLKQVNGLEFNGFILYGIDSYLLSKTPKQAINGFIDNNEVWHENEWEKEYVFLGDSDISWYAYDLLADKYFELDKPSGVILGEFDTMDLLVDKLLGDALR